MGKVRHLELRYFWLQGRVRLKQVKLEKVDTNSMVADFFTKYSDAEVIKKHCKTLNLHFLVRGTVLTTALCCSGCSRQRNDLGGAEANR